MSDFFQSHENTAAAFTKRSQPWRMLRDVLSNVRITLGRGMRRVRRRAAKDISSKILVTGVAVPGRLADLDAVITGLCQGSRHTIAVSITSMGDMGKFANIDRAIEQAPEALNCYDWLVIVDDDIAFELGRLDDMVALATQADLALSQPAHAYASHATYAITRRRPGALVRRTDFVEIGPLTLMRADLFDELIPFPASRWCYGIDLVWSEAARRTGRKIGIVDGTPIRHLRPVAGGYDMEVARIEGNALLKAMGVTISRAEIFAQDQVVLRV